MPPLEQIQDPQIETKGEVKVVGKRIDVEEQTEKGTSTLQTFLRRAYGRITQRLKLPTSKPLTLRPFGENSSISLTVTPIPQEKPEK